MGVACEALVWPPKLDFLYGVIFLILLTGSISWFYTRFLELKINVSKEVEHFLFKAAEGSSRKSGSW